MIVVQEGLVSIYSFIGAAILPFCVLPLSVYILNISSTFYSCLISIISSHSVVFSICLCFTGSTRQVALRASLLGIVFGAGICVSIFADITWSIFGWYTCYLAFFHYSEYLTIALTNPKILTVDSFMLNHSLAYKSAVVASWMEFFVEHYFFPNLKSYVYVSIIGVILCTSGEFLRKLSMFTANTNFNHVVKTVKERDHVLVTHGVYSLCRHPSYVGWFYFSIGTQMILVNPVCVVVYAIVSWSFFRNRLLFEEELLLNFFGEEYVEYKKRVHSGFPCNDGVQLEE